MWFNSLRMVLSYLRLERVLFHVALSCFYSSPEWTNQTLIIIITNFICRAHFKIQRNLKVLNRSKRKLSTHTHNTIIKCEGMKARTLFSLFALNEGFPIFHALHSYSAQWLAVSFYITVFWWNGFLLYIMSDCCFL